MFCSCALLGDYFVIDNSNYRGILTNSVQLQFKLIRGIIYSLEFQLLSSYFDPELLL